MKKVTFFFPIFLMSCILCSCATKILFIGELPDARPQDIPNVFKLSKPDGGFQIVQIDERTYLWLATNVTLPAEIKNINIYTREKVNEVAGSLQKLTNDPEIQYFEEGKYRVVRMVSTGTAWDYVFLFEEFQKIKNANTLKFSVSSTPVRTYLFSYKK